MVDTGYDLIILKNIGSEGQANYYVNTNHHSCLLQAGEQAVNMNTNKIKPNPKIPSLRLKLQWNNLTLVLWALTNLDLGLEVILTQSWQWWRCWQCSWRWTPRSRSWAPTWLSPPPGRSMYRRRGLKNNVQTFLDEILVWEFFNHLGDAETPQRWCNWLSATTKSLTIIFWSKILIV